MSEGSARCPGTAPRCWSVWGSCSCSWSVSVLARDRAAYAGNLDPRNPSANGAQALARVLDERGVEVRIARGAAALAAAPVDAATVVVVTEPEQLAPSTLKTLRAHARGAVALVFVGGAALLGTLLDADLAGVPQGARPARCDNPLVEDLTVQVHGGGLAAPGCFGSAAGSVLVQRAAEWALSSPASLANEHVLEQDNAALGLRLLGQGERLVWYVADPADAAPSEGFSISALLPPWLDPALGLLVASVLALMLWRGRRLGPLVTEPLPVVVRAAESTHSRGRIYRRTADREHVARSSATPPGAGSSRACGCRPGPPWRRSPQRPRPAPAATRARCSTCWLPHRPHHDARLVDLGRRLIDLENEVRTP